jgi:hypothetical protein
MKPNAANINPANPNFLLKLYINTRSKEAIPKAKSSNPCLALVGKIVINRIPNAMRESHKVI